MRESFMLELEDLSGLFAVPNFSAWTSGLRRLTIISSKLTVLFSATDSLTIPALCTPWSGLIQS
jgi:hypothetical protein